MKWKRIGYPRDGATFEVIMKGNEGKRKTLAYIHENDDRTALMVKSTSGQYWRAWSESLIAWRPIVEVDIGSIEDIKTDIEDIKRMIENYSGVSQIFDNEFGDTVNECGTYDALHSMRIAAKISNSHISKTVIRIFSKYESIIENRKYGLISLYNYLHKMIDD